MGGQIMGGQINYMRGNSMRGAVLLGGTSNSFSRWDIGRTSNLFST
jgi:hypothetical protein